MKDFNGSLTARSDCPKCAGCRYRGIEGLEECESKLERSQPRCGECLAVVFFRSSFRRYSYRPSVGSKKSNPQSNSSKVEFSTAQSLAQAIPANLLKLFKKTPSIAACGKSSSFMILLSALIIVLICLTSKVLVKPSVPKST